MDQALNTRCDGAGQSLPPSSSTKTNMSSIPEIHLPTVVPKTKVRKKWTSENRPYKSERLSVLIHDSMPVRVKCSFCGHERDGVSPEYVFVTCEYAAKCRVFAGEQRPRKESEERTS